MDNKKVSRRERRYIRRQQKRQEKLDAVNKAFAEYSTVTDFVSLYQAARKSARGVRFKHSVQKYEHDILFNSFQLSEDLRNNVDIREGFVTFMLCEYGKWRKIDAVKFRERVAQKSLCINALIPVLLRTILKENSASQKNKGIKYAHETLTKQLKDYYKTILIY